MFSFICNLSIAVCPHMAQQSNLPTHFLSPGRRTICWLHNLLHLTNIFFCFQQTIAFSPVYSCLIFIMSLHVSFFCHLSIPVCSLGLSRAINQHIFNCLAGTQSVDRTTCLTLQIYLCFNFSRQLHSRQFIYVWVGICLNMFCSCVSFICNLSIPVCSHGLSRATMDHHPKELAPSSWCARAIQVPICLPAHVFVCLTQFRLQPPVTST